MGPDILIEEVLQAEAAREAAEARAVKAIEAAEEKADKRVEAARKATAIAESRAVSAEAECEIQRARAVAAEAALETARQAYIECEKRNTALVEEIRRPMVMPVSGPTGWSVMIERDAAGNARGYRVEGNG